MNKEDNEIPFVAFGNDELGDDIKETIKCPGCKKKHKVKYGERVLEDGKRVPDKMLAFVNCGEQSFLVGLDGREVPPPRG